MSKGRTQPQCHPNRKHYAKGLCASCYHAQAVKRKKQKKHKEPVVVTHTHEVIRQVQQEEKQTMPAAHENDKPKAKDDAPKAVTSPAGTTEPTVELGGDGVTPKAEWDKKYAEFKKTQDEWDEKRRQRAVEDAGPMLTTEKVKHEGKHTA